MSQLHFNLSKIDNQRIKYKHPTKCTFLSLQEYTNLAENLIKKYAVGQVRKSMLNSDDAISYVVTKLGLADWRYDSVKHAEVPREAYRCWCGKLAVQDYIRYGKQRKNQSNTLDFVVMQKEDKTEQYNILSNQVQFLLDNAKLTDIQRKCVELHFFDDMSYASIGRKLGTSRANIEQHVLQAKRKMRSLIGQH